MIEIKRKYVQGGKVIDNSFTNLKSLTKQYNSVSDEFCIAQKKAFSHNDSFTEDSGFRQVRATLNKGQILMFWLWDDHDVNMLWMDSVYPTNSSKAGSARGPCKTSLGVLSAEPPSAQLPFEPSPSRPPLSKLLPGDREKWH
jgi:cellulose 1,4-beta-cellobiosidase